MQRKNNILKSSSQQTHRSAMAMIMAIAVIVIMGTIMALSLALTSQTTKRTTELYLYEQSVLLSKSATEYALLRVAQNLPCSYTGDNFTQNDLYDINISVAYIYYDDPATAGANEAQNICTANGGTLYTSVSTPEQNGSIILDVAVSVNDQSVSTEPIRYFRRTLQKL